MKYEDALDRAISLAGDPDELAAFLAGVPAWREELERAVRASRAFADGLRAVLPADEATERSWREVASMVGRLRATGATSPAASRRAHGLLRGYRLLVAGAGAALLLALAVVADLPSLAGRGAPQAEAVVIEGNVAEVGVEGVRIRTDDSDRLVKLQENTVLTDGFGNPVTADKLSAGQNVVLKGSRSGDVFVASEVELKDRLFGQIAGVFTASIRLRSASGEFLILTTPETEVEGRLAVGAFVEVKVRRSADGSLTALEIENEDTDAEEGREDGHGGRGPSVQPTPTGTQAPARDSRESEDRDRHEQPEDDDRSGSGEHESEDRHESGSNKGEGDDD